MSSASSCISVTVQFANTLITFLPVGVWLSPRNAVILLSLLRNFVKIHILPVFWLVNHLVYALLLDDMQADY